MTVGLFIPCYIDQFYPHVAKATLELLEKAGCEVRFPLNQTCCGQPMANSGFEKMSTGCIRNFIDNFSDCDYIVSPSGSCSLFIKEHYPHIDHSKEVMELSDKVFELCEFLVEKDLVSSVRSRFPFKVGLHVGCHGQRGLRICSSSELNCPSFSKVQSLLDKVEGIELVPLNRKDECCGFGGTFSVTEEAVSVKMGKDRVDDFLSNEAEFITGTDMSCLMHLEGIIKKQKKNIQIKHLVEILNAE